MTLRFKLDENADPRWRTPIEAAGYEVSTAAEENLCGTSDETVIETCRSLGFCLITADTDFGHILQYPPKKYAGIVVLWHPKPTLSGMLLLVREVAAALSKDSPVGKLWIVEPGRMRVRG